jgi:hypothetical protein
MSLLWEDELAAGGEEARGLPANCTAPKGRGMNGAGPNEEAEEEAEEDEAAVRADIEEEEALAGRLAGGGTTENSDGSSLNDLFLAEACADSFAGAGCLGSLLPLPLGFLLASFAALRRRLASVLTAARRNSAVADLSGSLALSPFFFLLLPA